MLATVYSTRASQTTEPTETRRTVSAPPETGRVIGHTTLSLVYVGLTDCVFYQRAGFIRVVDVFFLSSVWFLTIDFSTSTAQSGLGLTCFGPLSLGCTGGFSLLGLTAVTPTVSDRIII